MDVEITKIAPTDKRGNLLLTNWLNNRKLDEFGKEDREGGN